MSKSVPNDIVKIISSLASEDSIKILLACEKGIEKSTEVIKKLGLTQKVYYTWLAKLIDAGLVEKTRDSYKVTLLGKYCIRLLEAFINIINGKDRLELMDKMLKSDGLSDSEKETVLKLLSSSKLFEAMSVDELLFEVKVITDYEQLINEVIRLIDSARESAYIATKRKDLKVADSILKTIKRRVNLFFLSEKSLLSVDLQVIFRILLNPALRDILHDIMKNLSDLNIRVAENIPFNFIVVDGEYGILELPYLKENDNFLIAFKFKDSETCRKLVDIFNSIYERAIKDPRLESLKKYLTSSPLIK